MDYELDHWEWVKGIGLRSQLKICSVSNKLYFNTCIYNVRLLDIFRIQGSKYFFSTFQLREISRHFMKIIMINNRNFGILYNKLHKFFYVCAPGPRTMCSQ